MRGNFDNSWPRGWGLRLAVVLLKKWMISFTLRQALRRLRQLSYGIVFVGISEFLITTDRDE